MLPKQLKESSKLCIPLSKSLITDSALETLKTILIYLKNLSDKLEIIISSGKYDIDGRKLTSPEKDSSNRVYSFQNSIFFKLYTIKNSIKNKLHYKSLIESIKSAINAIIYHSPLLSPSEINESIQILSDISNYFDKDHHQTLTNFDLTLKKLKNSPKKSWRSVSNINYTKHKDYTKYTNLVSVLQRPNPSPLKQKLIPVPSTGTLFKKNSPGKALGLINKKIYTSSISKVKGKDVYLLSLK
jgi:hypothetical protein